MIDIIELQEMAKKYGFRDVITFSEWVEDNNLGEILFGLDQEDIENNKKEIDKDSMKYKATMLALDVLSLPEVKNSDSINPDQWIKLSRKVRKKNIKNRKT